MSSAASGPRRVVPLATVTTKYHGNSTQGILDPSLAIVPAYGWFSLHQQSASGMKYSTQFYRHTEQVDTYVGCGCGDQSVMYFSEGFFPLFFATNHIAVLSRSRWSSYTFFYLCQVHCT